MDPIRSALRFARWLLVVAVVVFAGLNCGTSSDEGGGTVTALSLDLTPSTLSLAAGTSSTLKAATTLSDGTREDVTATAAWTTSDAKIATVTAGKVTALKIGAAVLTATSGSLTKTVALTVTAPTLVSINVTPAKPTLAKGLTKQLVATGTFTDSTTKDLSAEVTWSSATATIATVDAKGMLSGVAPGTSNVSATSAKIAGSTVVTITDAEVLSIAVTPPSPTVPKGVTKQFAATATMTDSTTEDLTTQAVWSSSAPAIATVDAATGLGAGVAKGAADITATFKGISGVTTMTVTDAQLVSIGVTPATPSIAKGLKQQFTATGTYSDATTQNITTQAVWASSAVATATISNAAGSLGLATSIDIGATTISATVGAVTSSTTLTVTPATLVSIAVTPAAPSIAKGLSQQFTATGTYTDGTTQPLTTTATWASSDTAKATISNAAGSQGLASTAAVGTTTISAKDPASAVSGSTTLTVTAAALVSIAVTPDSPSIAKGLKQQFVATGTYTDASTQILTTTATWTSADTTKATISNAAGSQGLASSVAVGSSVISAKDPGTGVTGSTTLTVSAATLLSIAVTPANPSVVKGLTKQFIATGTYTDASTQVLTTTATWASADTTKATISNAAGSQGLASTAGVGTSVISAKDPGTGVTGSTTLTVTPATLVSIAVTPATPTIAVGATQPFVATGTYTDASTQVLTTTATWASSDTTKATISNAAGSQGLATATAVTGTTTISAKDPGTGVTGSTLLTVVVLPPQCLAGGYTVIDEPDRNVGNGVGANCDYGVTVGNWIRFVGAGGTTVPTARTPEMQCGTYATGWINGPIPTVAGTSTNPQGCFAWSGSACLWSDPAIVTNCGGFLVYNLKDTTGCYLRYCTE